MHEPELYPVPEAWAKRAYVDAAGYSKMHGRSLADPGSFWLEQAKRLTWIKRPEIAGDWSFDAGDFHIRWFSDGKLNVSANCIDRHLDARGSATAIIWEPDDPAAEPRRISYAELHREVCRFANVLKAQGVETGDRVVIYMPMIPEVIIAIQACARIGAIHSVVFGGFSANALRERIEDAGARLLVTADGGWRGGQIVELKAAADRALDAGCPSVETVVVCRRTGQAINMRPGRDVWWDEVVAEQAEDCQPAWVEAEHPLFLLYTSGSTGKPKGIQHSSAGYLLNAVLTCKWVFDLQSSDVFWCTADVGWVTGHTYVAYGPLAAGATMLMYEGAPTWPDGGRFWKNCERHGVTVFYTAPTAIRALMKLGDDLPAQYDLAKLRLLGTVGEPINPEAWMW